MLTEKIKNNHLLNEVLAKLNFSGQELFYNSLSKNLLNIDANLKKRIDQSGDKTETVLLNLIVQHLSRPVLLVENGDFRTPKSLIWQGILSPHKDSLTQFLNSVGRVTIHDSNGEVKTNGTGFVCERPNLFVTNYCIARAFSEYSGEVATKNNKRVSRKTEFSQIEFNENPNYCDQSKFILSRILFADKDKNLSLFEIKNLSPNKRLQPEPLKLCQQKPMAGDLIIVAGFPTEGEKADLVAESVLKKLYHVKRLAPGHVSTLTTEDFFYHDCLTFPGNCGSPVINLSKGALISGIQANCTNNSSINKAVESNYLLHQINQLQEFN